MHKLGQLYKVCNAIVSLECGKFVFNQRIEKEYGAAVCII